MGPSAIRRAPRPAARWGALVVLASASSVLFSACLQGDESTEAPGASEDNEALSADAEENLPETGELALMAISGMCEVRCCNNTLDGPVEVTNQNSCLKWAREQVCGSGKICRARWNGAVFHTGACC